MTFLAKTPTKKRDEEHCWRCGRKFGTILYDKMPGIIPVGEVLPDDDESCLCSECMDLELEEEMEREEASRSG